MALDQLKGFLLHLQDNKVGRVTVSKQETPGEYN